MEDEGLVLERDKCSLKDCKCDAGVIVLDHSAGGNWWFLTCTACCVGVRGSSVDEVAEVWNTLQSAD